MTNKKEENMTNNNLQSTTMKTTIAQQGWTRVLRKGE
jgi:hypothetical protein